MSASWRCGNGHCDNCSCAAVQNEEHVLIHCQLVYVLSQKEVLVPFLPFMPVLFCGGPL